MEINQEALEAMTIADLTGLITLTKLYPNAIEHSAFVCQWCQKELKKRLDNIFI